MGRDRLTIRRPVTRKLLRNFGIHRRERERERDFLAFLSREKFLKATVEHRTLRLSRNFYIISNSTRGIRR